jgi:hypothetical protein
VCNVTRWESFSITEFSLILYLLGDNQFSLKVRALLHLMQQGSLTLLMAVRLSYFRISAPACFSNCWISFCIT